MSAQPPLDQAYNTAGNPASKEPVEQAQSNATGDDAPTTDQRIPSKQTMSSDEATPSAMGQGIRGAGPGEDASKLNDQEQGISQDVNAEQMGAPGEGKVADAVKGKSEGSGGQEPGLETDLDRKKAEQAPMRGETKAQQSKDLDVGGILGQRSAPADPTEKK